jgi:hypothetical protein
MVSSGSVRIHPLRLFLTRNPQGETGLHQGFWFHFPPFFPDWSKIFSRGRWWHGLGCIVSATSEIATTSFATATSNDTAKHRVETCRDKWAPLDRWSDGAKSHPWKVSSPLTHKNRCFNATNDRSTVPGTPFSAPWLLANHSHRCFAAPCHKKHGHRSSVYTEELCSSGANVMRDQQSTPNE